MASRAILRRKRYILNSLNQPSCLIWGSSIFEREQPSQSSELKTASLFSSHLHSTTGDRSDKDATSALWNDPLDFRVAEIFRRYSFTISTLGNRVGRQDFVSSPRVVWTSQSIRYTSMATAGQPKFGSGDRRNEQQVSGQKTEPSPEECDQAVEGLSTVKAKAKAKQIQESPKSDKSVTMRMWAMLLGIGPALKAVASMSREDWAKKLHHWMDEFKSTMQHYWLGTKLLWADVRISSRLLLKLASGKSLSRRELKQLIRTAADIFKLVPLAIIVGVPFLEFLVPVIITFFPNILPSQFKYKVLEQEELKRKLNARLQYARFLQDTVKEMAKEIQTSRSGEVRNTAEDLDEFMNKVRKGERVSNDEILGFAKFFNDELTLDNISRPRLMNMCKYMGITPLSYVTDSYLRYVLRRRLQKIKDDDKLIQAEGLESLSEEELIAACRERGILGSRSVEEMREELRDWLDLSLNQSVPSSLLILSRAFSVRGKVTPEEAVQATLSSLPDEVVDTVGVTALPSEDPVAERRRKLEVLEMQEELIKEEEKEEEKQAKLKESISKQPDVALEEMTIPTAREAQERARAKTLDKQGQLCELSRALAVLASASSVRLEREEFLKLVRKEIELYNDMVDKEGTEGEEEAKKAYKAARKDSDHAAGMALSDKASSALADRVDAMLQKLEKEIDDVDAKIGDRWRLLDRDYDGKVTPEEVASAAIYLKDTLGKEGIDELINNLSKDRDGKILVEDIVRLASSKEDADSMDAR
ncbi:mitochondrial proton/calcium exchanger protein [Morus notabilis]|uniref:mitochondrial proton/calcium exchanger protein n=1 Tax=Morus notabilis TaxID=981085 RepID=UPI000CED354A|nr:mitochondrial proton/calcium exchanger protein [Morus notabilis]